MPEVPDPIWIDNSPYGRFERFHKKPLGGKIKNTLLKIKDKISWILKILNKN